MTLRVRQLLDLRTAIGRAGARRPSPAAAELSDALRMGPLHDPLARTSAACRYRISADDDAAQQAINIDHWELLSDPRTDHYYLGPPRLRLHVGDSNGLEE